MQHARTWPARKVLPGLWCCVTRNRSNGGARYFSLAEVAAARLGPCWLSHAPTIRNGMTETPAIAIRSRCSDAISSSFMYGEPSRTSTASRPICTSSR